MCTQTFLVSDEVLSHMILNSDVVGVCSFKYSRAKRFRADKSVGDGTIGLSRFKFLAIDGGTTCVIAAGEENNAGWADSEERAVEGGWMKTETAGIATKGKGDTTGWVDSETTATAVVPVAGGKDNVGWMVPEA